MIGHPKLAYEEFVAAATRFARCEVIGRIRPTPDNPIE